jgi:Flp pilus assembly protein TadG
MKKRFKQRGRSGERGNTVVELALGVGILSAVFTGTFQYGYTFYVYNNVQTAVNNGAKYAALRTYEQTTNSPSTCFTTAVQDMVAYGDPTGTTTTPVAPGLAPSDVVLSVTFSNGVPSQMQVNITNYSINSVFGSVNFTNKPSATYPFLGRYAPTNSCVQ